MKHTLLTLAGVTAAAVGVLLSVSSSEGKSNRIVFSMGGQELPPVTATSHTEQEDRDWYNRSGKVNEAVEDGLGYKENGFRLAENKKEVEQHEMPFLFPCPNIATSRYDCAGLVFHMGGLLPEAYYMDAAIAFSVLKNFGIQVSAQAQPGDVVVVFDKERAPGVTPTAVHVAYVIKGATLLSDAVVLTKDESERVYVGKAGGLTPRILDFFKPNSKLNKPTWKYAEVWRVKWSLIKARVFSPGAITISNVRLSVNNVELRRGDAAETGDPIKLDFDYVVSSTPPDGLEVQDTATVLGTSAITNPAYSQKRRLNVVSGPTAAGKEPLVQGNATYTHRFMQAGTYTWRIEVTAPDHEPREAKIDCRVKESTKAGYQLIMNAQSVDKDKPYGERIRNGGMYKTKDPDYRCDGRCVYYTVTGREADRLVTSVPPKPVVRGRCNGGPVFYGIYAGETPRLPKPPPGSHQYLYEVVDAEGKVIESLQFTVADSSSVPPDNTAKERKLIKEIAEGKIFMGAVDVYNARMRIVKNYFDRREWDAALGALQEAETELAKFITEQKLQENMLQIRHDLAICRGDFKTAITIAQEKKDNKLLAEDYLRLYHDVAKSYEAWTRYANRSDGFKPTWDYGWPVKGETPRSK